MAVIILLAMKKKQYRNEVCKRTAGVTAAVFFSPERRRKACVLLDYCVECSAEWIKLWYA